MRSSQHHTATQDLTQDSTQPPEAATMQAIVQERYGSADELRLTTTDVPQPTAGEVLIEVHAAGLDRGTWHLMTGKPYVMRLALGFRGPRNHVPGLDVAGTVVASGTDVTGFAVGDEVFGISKGSFADYAVARADRLALKPSNLTFEQAAVVPVSGLTAQRAVVDVGRVRAGQQVLVIGASGGVGSYAVQLAAAAGATVTGVCSAAKVDLVRSLGATEVLDYGVDDFSDGSRRYDVIIDIAGNPSLSRLRRALTPTGTAVLTGGEEGDNLTGGLGRQVRAMVLSRFVGQRLTGFVPAQRGSDLARLAEVIESGKVTPSVDRTYPLASVPEAMRRLAAGQVRGKVAITVAAS